MFVDLAHGSLFYDVVEPQVVPETRPDTIIFLHGVATNHEIWRHWVPVLSPEYRLVLIGTRGFGRSTGMGRVETWTLDDVSYDILAVADDVGVERFHVVGESFGGTAVLNLALCGLDRLLSATMVTAAHKGGQIEKVKAWRDTVEQNGIARWSEQMMVHRFKTGALPDDQYRWFHEQQNKTAAGPLLHLGELLLETDLTPKLARLACPLLIISPDQSPFVTPDIGAEIMRLAAGAELCVIPNSRHGIVFSHGAFCAGQLRDFLGRLPLRGGIAELGV